MNTIGQIISTEDGRKLRISEAGPDGVPVLVLRGSPHSRLLPSGSAPFYQEKQTARRMDITNNVMKTGAIISRAESLQILRNDLRKAALEKRSAELKEASTEKHQAILAEIELRDPKGNTPPYVEFSLAQD